MTTPTANAVLMGGGGAPSAKFSAVGTVVEGRIVAISEPYQEREYFPSDPGNGPLKFFKNGNPIMTFNLDLATDQRDPAIEDDDGTRRVYMDGARIKKAVRAAVHAAGAPGLEVGGHLAITYTHDDVPGDSRSGKNYSVTYRPGAPANAVLMDQREVPEPVAATPAPVAAPVTGQPSPEQVAAIKAAGMDPSAIFPGYQPS